MNGIAGTTRTGAAPGLQGRGDVRAGARALFVALLAPVCAPLAARAQTVPVQYFYVSIPEEEFRTYANAQGGGAESDVQRSIISITATFNGTVISCDEWEDGCEYDITAPTQSTTKVWGDGNPANGIPPGFATDSIDAGDVITLQNDVPVLGGGFGWVALSVMSQKDGTVIQIDADANGSFEITQTLDDLDAPGTPLAAARSRFTGAVNAGVSLAAHLGHAGYDFLADEGLVRAAVEVPALNNGERLPLFLLPTLRFAGEDRPRLGDLHLAALAGYRAVHGSDSTLEVSGILGDPAQRLPWGDG